MTKKTKSNLGNGAAPSLPTKHQQVVELLRRDAGATLEELSVLASWLPHSTRAFITGLKKKGHVIDSEMVDGIRHYRIVPAEVA